MSEYLCDQDQIGDQTGAHQASELSQHTKRQLIQSEKWKECIPSAVVEGESMKTDAVCMNCGAPGNVRCHQCGPSTVFCSDCGVNFHTRCNYHHFPEKWKVCVLTSCSTSALGSLVAYNGCQFIPLELLIPSIKTHSCDSHAHRIVTCFHVEGSRWLLL